MTMSARTGVLLLFNGGVLIGIGLGASREVWQLVLGLVCYAAALLFLLRTREVKP